MPGHWEGGLVFGKRPSAVGTLVERHSRYVLLFPHTWARPCSTSLNFSFLRAILDAGPDLGLSLRAARWGLRQLSRRFPIQSLYQFNKKFAPAWQPRYLAVQTAEELATVALACLRAEGPIPGGTRATTSTSPAIATPSPTALPRRPARSPPPTGAARPDGSLSTRSACAWWERSASANREPGCCSPNCSPWGRSGC